MLAFGFAVASLALFGYSHMNLQSGAWDILAHQINQGIGMSFIFVPLTILTMDPIPKQLTGYATSLYSVMRNIGSSIGVSFVTTSIARRSQFNQSVLAAHLTPYGLTTQQMLRRTQACVLRGGSDPATAHHRALGLLYGTLQQPASLLSYMTVFRMMGYLSWPSSRSCCSSAGPLGRPLRAASIVSRK